MLFHRFSREPARAYTLCNLAVLERSDGNADAARSALDDALERFRALGDSAGEALALTGLGNWARTFGDPDSALDWLERARELRRRNGDRRAVAMTEMDLALALAFGGDLEGARVVFAELGDRFRAADDAPGQGGAFILWGIAEERRKPRAGAELGAAPRSEPHPGGHLPAGPGRGADMYETLGSRPAAERSVARAERVLARAGDVRGLELCHAHPAAKGVQRSGKDALS
jgi:tetratricopeptide (TPR) repeat protein